MENIIGKVEDIDREERWRACVEGDAAYMCSDKSREEYAALLKPSSFGRVS